MIEFIFYNSDKNLLLTYSYSSIYQMYIVKEVYNNKTITQLIGHERFKNRLHKEKNEWHYIGQV
jgi:hypothetical protein